MSYTILEMARLALAVYEGEEPAEGWKLITPFVGSHYNGFYAALFQRGECFALAIRGTDDRSDIIPDAEIFLGALPSQMPNAEEAYQTATHFVQRRRLVLTGHSLGGGLAILLAGLHGLPAVTFNAPGVALTFANSRAPFWLAPMLPFGLRALPGLWDWARLDTSKIINIRALGDVVSLGTGPQLGRVDSIGVAGCSAALQDFAWRLQRLPIDMLTNQSEGNFDPNGLSLETTLFVLCQHGMNLMFAEIANRAEFQKDLGW